MAWAIWIVRSLSLGWLRESSAHSRVRHICPGFWIFEADSSTAWHSGEMQAGCHSVTVTMTQQTPDPKEGSCPA